MRRSEEAATPAPPAGLWVPAFLALALLIQCALALTGRTPILDGRLVDTDNYMWLARLAWRIDHGSWFDPVFPPLNAPWGHTINWTRPTELLLLGLAAPMIPFVGTHEAVWSAGIVASPLAHALACLAMAWAARPLVGAAYAPLVAVASLAAPAFLDYSLLGRPDHHAPLGLVIALSLGGVLRIVLAGAGSRTAFATGVALAVGLWIGIEFFVPLAILLAGVAAWWAVATPASGAARPTALALGLAVGLGLAQLAERGPSAALAVDYDMLGLPHVALGLLHAAAWLALGFAERAGRVGAPRIRLGALALAAAGGAVLMGLAFPRIFLGPGVDFDPLIGAAILPVTSEFRPLLAADREALRDLLIGAGPAALATAWAAIAARRAGDPARVGAWAMLAALSLAYFSLALVHSRFTMFAGLVAAPALVDLIARLHARFGSGIGATSAAARIAATMVVLFGLPALGALVDRAGAAATVGRASPGVAARACDLRALAAALGREPAGTIVVAHPSLGPELAWRTPFGVVGSLYARNPSGLRDTLVVLTATDDAAAREVIARRGVSLLVVCPARDADHGPGSLARRLLAGPPPVWLAAVPLASSGFLVFRVAR